MKTTSILMSAALLLLAVTAALGQQHIAAKVEPVAMESLVLFKTLLTDQKNYRQMGFESAEEAARMTLGVPMQVYMVPLDRLRNYAGGTPPESLLMDTRHILYPVRVDNQTRSSLMLAEAQGSWKAVSFGSPTLIRKICEARMISVGVTGMATVEHFVVEIPALNLHFIGIRQGGALKLAPIVDDARLDFRAGISQPAERVFTALVPYAKAHDGLPR